MKTGGVKGAGGSFTGRTSGKNHIAMEDKPFQRVLDLFLNFLLEKGGLPAVRMHIYVYIYI